jgi:hypothetical protein
MARRLARPLREKIRKLLVRIAKAAETQSVFRIRQFGAVDPSTPDGFRRYTIYNSQRVEELRAKYGNEDVYLSVFAYESEDFENCRLLGPYYLDLDSEADPAAALKEARLAVEVLKKLGLPDDYIRVYFSGCKGFHIEVPPEAFGCESHKDLDKIWRTLTQMIVEHLKEQGVELRCVDWRIYDRRRLWRLPNSVNSKTGLYKIPLTVQEINTLTLDDILKIAEKPRDLPTNPNITPLPNLQALFQDLVKRVESQPLKIPLTFKREVDREPYRGPDPPCIQFLLTQKLREGELGGRNNAALILFSYFFNFKMLDREEALEKVLEWNAKNIKPLPQKELENVIKSSANHGYVFGCQTLERYYCNRWECPLIPRELKPFTSDVVEKARQLAKDPKLLDKFIEVTNRWVVRDEVIRRLCLRAYVSAFTDDPINLALLGRDSIGKTYNAVVVSKLLPEQHVWCLGGLSPTALANDYGVWDSDNRCFIVDLNQKILIFLEPPPKETLDRLKPILSHDRTEVTYKVTQKTKGGQLRTVTTHLRGWPVVVICAAKTGYVSEYSTRWLTATPEISVTKTKDALRKLAEITANPKFFERVEEVQIWRAFFALIAKRAVIKVRVPYAPILAEHFSIRGPETMRVFKLFLRLIKANAALHVAQRRVDEDGYLLADYEDFTQVLEDFKLIAAPTFLGVSGDALNLYSNLQGRSDLRFEDIEAAARDVFGSDVPESNLRDLYIKRLVEAGLLKERTDPLDKRRIIYDAADKPVYITVFDDEEAVKEEVRASVAATEGVTEKECI